MNVSGKRKSRKCSPRLFLGAYSRRFYRVKNRNNSYAGVAELADALASGASDRKVMWVQVPSPAPYVKAPQIAVMAVCGVFAFYRNIEMSFIPFLRYSESTSHLLNGIVKRII